MMTTYDAESLDHPAIFGPRVGSLIIPDVATFDIHGFQMFAGDFHLLATGHLPNPVTVPEGSDMFIVGADNQVIVRCVMTEPVRFPAGRIQWRYILTATDGVSSDAASRLDADLTALLDQDQ